MNIHVRWMLRRDLPKVLDIESRSFDDPWLKDQFLQCLRTRNCIGMVAEYEGKLLGHMCYSLNSGFYDILDFAVCPDFRRQGVGTAMVNKLIVKLIQDNRTRVTTMVRETNLDAQLFFKSRGFRAVNIVQTPYSNIGEDGYEMEYEINADIPAKLTDTAMENFF